MNEQQKLLLLRKTVQSACWFDTDKRSVPPAVPIPLPPMPHCTCMCGWNNIEFSSMSDWIETVESIERWNSSLNAQLLCGCASITPCLCNTPFRMADRSLLIPSFRTAAVPVTMLNREGSCCADDEDLDAKSCPLPPLRSWVIPCEKTTTSTSAAQERPLRAATVRPPSKPKQNFVGGDDVLAVSNENDDDDDDDEDDEDYVAPNEEQNRHASTSTRCRKRRLTFGFDGGGDVESESPPLSKKRQCKSSACTRPKVERKSSACTASETPRETPSRTTSAAVVHKKSFPNDLRKELDRLYRESLFCVKAKQFIETKKNRRSSFLALLAHSPHVKCVAFAPNASEPGGRMCDSDLLVYNREELESIFTEYYGGHSTLQHHFWHLSRNIGSTLQAAADSGSTRPEIERSASRSTGATRLLGEYWRCKVTTNFSARMDPHTVGLHNAPRGVGRDPKLHEIWAEWDAYYCSTFPLIVGQSQPPPIPAILVATKQQPPLPSHYVTQLRLRNRAKNISELSAKNTTNVGGGRLVVSCT